MKSLSLKLALCVIAATTISGCLSKQKVKARLEADIWNIDNHDGSIYRELKTTPPTEEFFLCTDNSAKNFKAIHKDDLKVWVDKFLTKCTCTE
jgi:hypothetical protein